MSKELARKSTVVYGKTWVKGPTGVNVMLNGDEAGSWWISYNPSSTKTFGAGSFMAADQEAETAIVKDDNYYILNGDWRQDYEQLIDKGFKACKKFFDEHQEDKSSWSN